VEAILGSLATHILWREQVLEAVAHKMVHSQLVQAELILIIQGFLAVAALAVMVVDMVPTLAAQAVAVQPDIRAVVEQAGQLVTA
jgi:hypothetical protein